MKLIEINPKLLRDNPQNPRRTTAGAEADAVLLANVQAVGILQPPTAREIDGKVVLIAGHRRRDAAVAAKLPLIHVLIREEADDAVPGADGVRSLAENTVRAGMGPVDQWRAIEALVSEDWTEEAIGTALNMPVRRIRMLRHMTHILPAMLTQMARGDMPNEQQLRTIGLASAEEQASVWKGQKPKKNERANWNMVAHGLDKRRIPYATARFGEAEREAFNVTWHDDLFAPAGTESRFTTDVEAFAQAQLSWLENNLPAKGVLLDVDQWGSPSLPPRAQRSWNSKPGKDDLVGCYLNPRSFEVEQVLYRMPEVAPRRDAAGAGTGEDYTAPKAVRPDLTQKGEAMVGDLRTEALHKALGSAEISDHALIGLLVLALAGQNVSVRSGAKGDDIGSGQRGSLAASITEGGVLTADPETLRAAARGMLRQALSCRVGFSSSGMVARVAGIAVDADAYLPTTATEEFLGNLSKAAIERIASANHVLPRNTGKATRAALVDAKKGTTFLHPLVRFGFTEEERREAEKACARDAEYAALRRDGVACGGGEEDAGGDEDTVEGPEHLMDADEDAAEAPMPPPGDAHAPEAHAL